MQSKVEVRRLRDYNLQDENVRKDISGKIFYSEVKFGKNRKNRGIYRVLSVEGRNYSLLDAENLETRPTYINERNIETGYIGVQVHLEDIEVDKKMLTKFMNDRFLDVRFLGYYKDLLAT